MRAVCFDLGGTLIESTRPQDCCGYWRTRGRVLHPDAVRAALYRTDRLFMERFPEQWRTPGPAFCTRYWATVHGALGLDPPPVAVTSTWGAEWGRFPDALRTLHTLRRGGVRLGLVSNWNDTARTTLQATGLADSFDVVVLSSDLGCAKPDRRIFQAAASALGLPPSECFYVGDNFWDDVAGSQGAGMCPVLLDRHPEWHPAPESPSHACVARDLDAATLFLLAAIQSTEAATASVRAR